VVGFKYNGRIAHQVVSKNAGVVFDMLARPKLAEAATDVMRDA